MPLDLVIAVAMWCGSPGSNVTTGNQTTMAVQKCRDAVLACIPNKPNGQEDYEINDWKCFTDQKL